MCLTSATSASTHMAIGVPKGYAAMGCSMQRLPGGATAVVHSLQRPCLTNVLSDEPDMPGCAMSEVNPVLVPCLLISANICMPCARNTSKNCCHAQFSLG